VPHKISLHYEWYLCSSHLQSSDSFLTGDIIERINEYIWVASSGMIFKPSLMKIGKLKSYCGGGGQQTHNSFLLIFFAVYFMTLSQ
jgi:hypothetical protein